MDELLCVIIPLGKWKEGGIGLYKLKTVIDINPSDLLVFCPGTHTHFNKHYSGIRFLVVLHMDKEGYKWVTNSNGWVIC
jgi:hypothetical protein